MPTSAPTSAELARRFARQLTNALASLVRVDDTVTDRERVADLRRRYVDGELSLREFERRVGMVLDADACHLRCSLERVDGIGPETSAAVAARFPTVETVRDADRAELVAVDGVGPERAAAIDAELAE